MERKVREFLADFGELTKEIEYDGWPIWWFFKRRFTENCLLPPLLTHQQIISKIKQGEEPKESKLTNLVMRKAIDYNEKCKFWLSSFNRRKTTSNSELPKVMFLAHTNAILPDNHYGFTVDRVGSLIKEIRADSTLQEAIFTISPLTHKPSLKLLKYPNLVYSYVDNEIKQEAKASKELHRKWSEGCYPTELIEYHPIPQYFIPAFELFFSREIIYYIILYYEIYKKIIKQEKIKLLCFYSGGGLLVKCAIAAAHNSGINSLHVPHGTANLVKMRDQPKSVYHAIIGDKYREKYTKADVNPKNIFLTGPVFMDVISKYKKDWTQENSGRKQVLFSVWATSDVPQCSQTLFSIEDYKSHLKRYLREINAVGNVKVIIKLHPRERNVKLYGDLARNYPQVSVVETKRKTQTKDYLYSTMRDSDLEISFGSTTSVEAIVIGTPSIIIDLPGTRHSDPVIINGIRHIGEDENLTPIVSNLLYNKKERLTVLEKGNKVAEKYLYKADGKAGKRVLEVIKKLIKCQE